MAFEQIGALLCGALTRGKKQPGQATPVQAQMRATTCRQLGAFNGQAAQGVLLRAGRSCLGLEQLHHCRLLIHLSHLARSLALRVLDAHIRAPAGGRVGRVDRLADWWAANARAAQRAPPTAAPPATRPSALVQQQLRGLQVAVARGVVERAVFVRVHRVHVGPRVQQHLCQEKGEWREEVA